MREIASGSMPIVLSGPHSRGAERSLEGRESPGQPGNLKRSIIHPHRKCHHGGKFEKSARSYLPLLRQAKRLIAHRANAAQLPLSALPPARTSRGRVLPSHALRAVEPCAVRGDRVSRSPAPQARRLGDPSSSGRRSEGQPPSPSRGRGRLRSHGPAEARGW